MIHSDLKPTFLDVIGRVGDLGSSVSKYMHADRSHASPRTRNDSRVSCQQGEHQQGQQSMADYRSRSCQFMTHEKRFVIK